MLGLRLFGYSHPLWGLPLTPLVLDTPGNQKKSSWSPWYMILPRALDMQLQRVDPKTLGRRKAGEMGEASPNGFWQRSWEALFWQIKADPKESDRGGGTRAPLQQDRRSLENVRPQPRLASDTRWADPFQPLTLQPVPLPWGTP